MWYLSIWLRTEAPYFSRRATDQMRRATRPMTVYSGSMPLEKKKERLGAEAVHGHAAGQVVLQVGEPVGQGEGQLADGVGPGFGDVVAGDGYRVEIAHIVFDEIGLDVTHHLEGEIDGEDAGVLPLVFLEDVGLNRAAHIGEHHGLDRSYSSSGAGGPFPGYNCPPAGRWPC
jgi:hypothetical protein